MRDAFKREIDTLLARDERLRTLVDSCIEKWDSTKGAKEESGV